MGGTIAALRLGTPVAVAVIAATTLVACFTKPGEPAVAGDAADAADAVMPPTSIQVIDSSGAKALAAPSLAAAFGQPIAAGDLIVVALGTYNGDAVRVEDTGANTYRDAMTTFTSPAGGKVTVFYAVNAALAQPLVVTAILNMAADSEVSMAIQAYRGTDPVEPLDQHRSATDLSTTSPSSGTLTTTHADGLYFGVLSHDAPVTTAAGPGYALRQVVVEDPAYVPLATEDKVGPAQTTAATFQLSGASSSGCALVTFK